MVSCALLVLIALTACSQGNPVSGNRVDVLDKQPTAEQPSNERTEKVSCADLDILYAKIAEAQEKLDGYNEFLEVLNEQSLEALQEGNIKYVERKQTQLKKYAALASHQQLLINEWHEQIAKC